MYIWLTLSINFRYFSCSLLPITSQCVFVISIIIIGVFQPWDLFKFWTDFIILFLFFSVVDLFSVLFKYYSDFFKKYNGNLPVIFCLSLCLNVFFNPFISKHDNSNFTWLIISFSSLMITFRHSLHLLSRFYIIIFIKFESLNLFLWILPFEYFNFGVFDNFNLVIDSSKDLNQLILLIYSSSIVSSSDGWLFLFDELSKFLVNLLLSMIFIIYKVSPYFPILLDFIPK